MPRLSLQCTIRIKETKYIAPLESHYIHGDNVLPEPRIILKLYPYHLNILPHVFHGSSIEKGDEFVAHLQSFQGKLQFFVFIFFLIPKNDRPTQQVIRVRDVYLFLTEFLTDS